MVVVVDLEIPALEVYTVGRLKFEFVYLNVTMLDTKFTTSKRFRNDSGKWLVV